MTKINDAFKLEMYDSILTIHQNLHHAAGLIDLGEQVPNEYLQDAIGGLTSVREKYKTKMMEFCDEEDKSVVIVLHEFDHALKNLREIHSIHDSDFDKATDMLKELAGDIIVCALSARDGINMINGVENSNDR